MSGKDINKRRCRNSVAFRFYNTFIYKDKATTLQKG